MQIASCLPRRASPGHPARPPSTLLLRCGCDSPAWMHIETEICKSGRDRERGYKSSLRDCSMFKEVKTELMLGG